MQDGYQTRVGENGILLSQGQQQRIALARAFIKNAELFIFDEALVGLDKATQTKVVANIQAYCKNKTCVLISHDAAHLQAMNRLLILENGALTQEAPQIPFRKASSLELF